MQAFDEVPALDAATRDTSSVDSDMFQVFSVTVRFRRCGFAVKSANSHPDVAAEDGVTLGLEVAGVSGHCGLRSAITSHFERVVSHQFDGGRWISFDLPLEESSFRPYY